MDAEAFLTIFRCPRAGANFMGYVECACVHFRLGDSWFTDTLAQTLKGSRKWSLRTLGSVLKQKCVVTDETSFELVALTDRLGPPSLSEFWLFCRENLARAQ